jgi:hypothetical protein
VSPRTPGTNPRKFSVKDIPEERGFLSASRGSTEVMRASTITWLRTAIPALVPPITPPRWKTCRRAVSASVPLQSEIYCHWSPPRRNIPSQARIAFAVFVSFAETLDGIMRLVAEAAPSHWKYPGRNVDAVE